MDRARLLAEGGAADRTVVQADQQTAGRGRQGRYWAAPSGNLYLTAIIREQRRMAECAALSFVSALALFDAVDLPQTRLKWPNDVLIDGAKAAGILLESGGSPDAPWILIGIGVNVTSHPDNTPYPATHLIRHGYAEKLGTLCRRVLAGLDHWRAIWHGQGASALHHAWCDRTVHERGQRLIVQHGQKATVEGHYQGLDASGALVIVDGTGQTHHIGAGDVFFS